MSRLAIAVNEIGRRIGESHPKAKLTDRDIDLIRELHEGHGMGYKTIARKFETSPTTVAYICRYEVRCQTPDHWRFVEVSDRFVLMCANGKWGFVREVVR